MELLQRRKLCREFLNGYNEKLHPQIISRVFEIGLLTLKNKFNKLLFSKEELDEIIKSLSGKEYVEIVPEPPKNKLETLTNKNYLEKLIYKDNNIPLSKEELERNKIIKNKQMHRHYLKNPNFSTQNNEIYPFWWWNNKEEKFDEINKNTINNNINLTNDDIYYDNNNIYNNYYDEENNLNNIDEMEYQGEELKNVEIGNKIKKYSEKKLDNTSIPIKKENFKYNKNLNKNKKLENKPRVQSTRAQRNNNINNQKFKKINNNMKIPNRGKKNLNLQKIPQFKYIYNNGRIVKIKENNYGINNDIMNLTEPNNNH